MQHAASHLDRTSRKRPSTIVLSLVLLVALALLPATARATIEWVGSVSSYSLVETGGKTSVVFTLNTGAECEVVPFAPDTIRVRYHFTVTGLWDKDDIAIDKPLVNWDDFGVTFTDLGGTFEIETDELIVEVVKSPNMQVHFRDKGDTYDLLRDVRMEYDSAYNPGDDPTYECLATPTNGLPLGFKLKCLKECPTNELYFGFGEYAAPLNRRGHDIQGWNSDTYQWVEYQNPMYMTLPFFYGVRTETGGNPTFAYGLFFNNPARPVFKMATEFSDWYSFEAGDGQLDYFFFGGGPEHTMRDILTRYTELTGLPVTLPKWAYGYHLSRWTYNNQDWVEWLAGESTAEDFPLDAIYLDIDYMDQDADDDYYDNLLWPLTFNFNYPDPGAMINNCMTNGVRLVPIVEPWLTLWSPMYDEAQTNLHFIKYNNPPDFTRILEQIYFGEVSWLDFTSTPCRDWWKGKVVNFLNSYPFEGIWNDLNEPAAKDTTHPCGADQIPLNGLFWLDGTYGDHTDSRRWYQNVKNTYCLYETMCTYDSLATKHSNKRPVVLSRAAFPGIQRYALNWSGDNICNWDHLRHNIGLGVSVMMSGQVNFGHDVGGFTGNPSGEIFTRWHEWAVLTPFCRNHSQKWDMEREPWRYGEPYKSHMRESIKFRYKLMPYLYTLAHESTQSGVPMNTPTVFHFTEDQNTYADNDTDFMVGDFLLAAPVWYSGGTTRDVYLPAGSDWYYLHGDASWSDWATDTLYSGGQWVQVAAPLGTLPLFARAGAIIPRGPAMQYANEYKPDWLDVHVWPYEYSEFTMYEDDGETLDYQSGESVTTRFTSHITTSLWYFTVGEQEGSYDPERDVMVVVTHDMDVGTNDVVYKDSNYYLTRYGSLGELHANPEGFYYDEADYMLTIKIQNSGQYAELMVFDPDEVQYILHIGMDNGVDIFPQELAEEEYYTGPAVTLMCAGWLDPSYSNTQSTIYTTYHTGAPGDDMNEVDLRYALNGETEYPVNFSYHGYTNQEEAIKTWIHWMDYIPPGATNVPSQIPLGGEYKWRNVRGFVTDVQPSVATNLWTIPDFTLYGIWVNDPAIGGLGYNVFQVASTVQAEYQLVNGEYLMVTEPPLDDETELEQLKAVLKTVTMTLANAPEANARLKNLLAAEAKAFKIKEEDATPDLEDLIPGALLMDPLFAKLFYSSKHVVTYEVTGLGGCSSYRLVALGRGGRAIANLTPEKLRELPYGKTSILIVLEDDVFSQATYVREPEVFPRISEEEALKSLINKYPHLDGKAYDMDYVRLPNKTPSAFHPSLRFVFDCGTAYVHADGDLGYKGLIKAIPLKAEDLKAEYNSGP